MASHKNHNYIEIVKLAFLNLPKCNEVKYGFFFRKIKRIEIPKESHKIEMKAGIKREYFFRFNV